MHPMCNQARALRWVTELLSGAGIPFQAVGGLAARAYGARRPLADLDFYVPVSALEQIAAAAAAYVVRPPAPYRDESWNLTFMKLEYEGCEIELGGADGAEYYDRHTAEWRSAAVRFDRSVERAVFGVAVPVVPLEELIAYKRALDREVDRQDLAELAAAFEKQADAAE